jgi:hypothetical protein
LLAPFVGRCYLGSVGIRIIGLELFLLLFCQLLVDFQVSLCLEFFLEKLKNVFKGTFMSAFSIYKNPVKKLS